MMKYLLATGSLMMMLGMGHSLPAFAQSAAPSAPAPSSAAIVEDDLKKFVSAAKKLETISRERNTQVTQAVQKEGLTVDRFKEIFLAQKDPNSSTASKISSDEKQKFERVLAMLSEIQKDTQTKMGSAVKAEGLEVPRFLQILDTIQKNPDLQKKVEQMLRPAGR
jgi:nanoRNase/pAp phosphatase (c-di-AMP/oligoRNAs hydrolase)